ncbi:MAG TPA: methylmalonyl-CoA epimerase [Trueperaceae bacterium]
MKTPDPAFGPLGPHHPVLDHAVLDHVGIAVADLHAASHPYRLLGLRPEGQDEVLEAQGVRVRAFRTAGGLLELLAPVGTEGPIAAFLAKRGPGLHHLALRVAALEPEIARLQAAGARFVDPEPRMGRAGSRVVFLHPKWAGGVLLELVEHD